MRVKTESRRQAFVKAAGKLFLQSGFDAVSMEAIAAEANASKVTLYGYFPSKEALFKAFAIDAGVGFVDDLPAPPQPGQDLREVLRRLGMAFLKLVTRPDIIALDRLITVATCRQPQMVTIFFENCFEPTARVVDAFFATCMELGLIRRGDVRMTAQHFEGLCAAGLRQDLRWGRCPCPDEARLARDLEPALDAFIRAYGL